MSDDRPAGPRRYVPVPGLVDLDAVDDDGPAPLTDAPGPADESAPAEAQPAEAEPAEGGPAEGGPAEGGPAEGGPGDRAHGAAPDAGAPALVPPSSAPLDDDPDQPPAGEGVRHDAGEEPTATNPPTAPHGPITDQRATEKAAAGPLVPAPVVESAREAARGRGRELVQLVVRYGRQHVPASDRPPPAPDTGPPRMVGRVGQLIPTCA